MKTKLPLTIKEGIPLAIGSIIGSGILFLPSVVFEISNNCILYVWILAILMCLPLLEIFNDMVKKVPGTRGIEGFVSLGLGHTLGATIPILFLGTVTIGMPTAAIIAGNYLSQFFGMGNIFSLCTAVVIIYFGIWANLSGTQAKKNLHVFITVMLLLVAIILISVNMRPIFHVLPTFLISFDVNAVLSGVLIAVWAFAGFENLTFIAGEFQHPSRDFRICAYTALIICGLLYLGLSLGYASVAKNIMTNHLTSLYVLAQSLNPKIIAVMCIVIFSIVCVQTNTISWIYGISRLICSSAKQKKLPPFLGQLNAKNIPARAIALLAILYGLVFMIYVLEPSWVKKALLLVSANFTFIYVLTIISYIRSTSFSVLKIFAYLLLILLCLMLLHAKWLLIYPFSLLLVGIFHYHFNFYGDYHARISR